MKKFLTMFSLMAVVVMSTCIPAFAVSYPAFTDFGSTENYMIVTYDGDYKAIKYSDIDLTFTWNGHQVVCKNNTKDTHFAFVVYDYENGSYVPSSNIQCAAGSTVTCVNIGWDVVYSDNDIYDTNGDLFFPLPPDLPEVVEELTVVQGMSVAEKVVGAMKILLPCGVGCLALLMAFPVLRKGLLRFLT